MKPTKVAVVGSGPAGLMAAQVLAQSGFSVKVFEKRGGLGRKILIAGSSGLNISFDCPIKDFLKTYSGPPQIWEAILKNFGPDDWLKFVAQLGLEPFVGTSKRYFVKDMKGANLLRLWVEHLKKMGVEFFLNQELEDFDCNEEGVRLQLGDTQHSFAAACLCMGGGSWESQPPKWPALLQKKNIRFHEFQSANCGFQVQWPEKLIQEAEGQPLKGIVLYSAKGSRSGELVITRYGLEGTPIYALGEPGPIELDLKPTLSEKEILKKLCSTQENLSPIRRVKKFLNLPPASLAVLFHCSGKKDLEDLPKLVARIKHFPLMLGNPQPLEEAISSKGGLCWSELNSSLMLKKYPGIFVAGEMIDWHAPTGGFLIQGCVSQGHFIGTQLAHQTEPLL